MIYKVKFNSEFITLNILIHPLEVNPTIVPVAVISNFSEGVPLMKRLLQDMNSLSDEWGACMVEKHHINKKDSPSGTALTLKKFINRDCEIMSIREGDILLNKRLIK